MHAVPLALSPRYITWTLSAAALVVFLALSALHPVFLIGAAAGGFLTWLGYHDVTQTRHSILRNYPIAGHLRFASISWKATSRARRSAATSALSSTSAPRGSWTSVHSAPSSTSTLLLMSGSIIR